MVGLRTREPFLPGGAFRAYGVPGSLLLPSGSRVRSPYLLARIGGRVFLGSGIHGDAS